MKDSGYRRTRHDGWRTWEALELASGFGFPGGVGYYDPKDPQAHMRPLTDRAVHGDWHATAYQKKVDGETPSERAVVPRKWWEFLIVDANTDTASGLGIELAGLRWFNCPPPKAAKNLVLTTPADAGREGGRQPKHNQGLQTVVNKLVSRLRKDGLRPTARTLLKHVKDNATADRPLEFDIPNCDWIYVDGDKLVWKDRDGREQSITERSLEPYVGRAKQTY